MSSSQSGPSGWTRVRFGEVVHLNTDRIADPQAEGIERYVGIEHIEPEDLRIRAWGLVEEGTTFTNYFKPGQVLFVKRRAYQRKVAVAEFEGVCSGDIYVLEPRDDRLLPDLLPFICQTESFFAYSVNTSAGSLSPRTNWKQLAEYEFALPRLVEQRRIAQMLSACEAASEALRSTIDIARTLRSTLALHLFESDSTAKKELKGVIADSLYGPRFSSKLYDEEGALAQLRTTDIDEDGNISYDTIPRARLSPDEYKAHILHDGDVVISRSGTCGLTAVYREQAIPIIPAAFLIRLRTTDDMLAEYLHEFFSSPIGRQLASSLSRGGVQKNISGSTLLAQPVPCPSLSRQAEVVHQLAQARTTENALQFREKSIAKLKGKVLATCLGEHR